MATLGSLNLGDLVYDPLSYDSSSYKGEENGQKRPIDCLCWRVIGKNVDGTNTVTLLNYNQFSGAGYYDYKESTNPDSDRASNGNSRYKFSNVLQWLNSEAQSNWYTAKHTYDAVYPSDNARKGFKYRMSTAMKNALQSFSKTSAIPTIDGGGTESVSAKVHLISMQETFGSDDAYPVEGSQYPYFSSLGTIQGYFTRTSVKNSTTISGSKIYRSGYKSNYSFHKFDAVPCYYVSDGVIVVLPSSTKISSDKYDYSGNGSDNTKYYAMLNMPLIIELSATTSFTVDNPQKQIKYKVYDENATISTFKIAVDSTDNVVYSTVNLAKGTEFTYNVDGSEWALNESHKYYFMATDSNDVSATNSITITRVNKSPEIWARFNDTDEWKTTIDMRETLGTMTKPFTAKLKIRDLDNLGQPMYVYFFSQYYWSNTPSDKYDLVGVYTTDQEIEYTVPDEMWDNISDVTNDYWYFCVWTTEFTGSTLHGSRVDLNYVSKSTPAPYIDIESTSLGRKNLGFVVNYTPKIDTIHTITNLKIYLDDTTTELTSIDNPTPDVELSYTITKSALYDLSIGEHTLIFVVSDDLGQSSTTNVTFTRYNDAPNIIAESSLGNKDLGFTGSFTVQDSEGDISSVNVYIDSVSSVAIKTQENVATGTEITYEVTKEQLYNLALGNHKIVVVATDDLGTSTTELTFTRTNDAPVITGNTALGNVNQPFTETVNVSDAENDTTSISFYMDSSSTAFYTQSDITHATDVSYTVTREMLDSLSLASHTIRAVATDSLGKTGTLTTTFTHYNVSPDLTLTQETTLHNGNFEVAYTVTDTDSDEVTINFKVDNSIVVANQTVTTNEEHTQVIPMNNVSFGDHTLKATVWDRWTSSSPTTQELSFTYNSLPVIEADVIGNVADGFVEPITVTDTDRDSVNLRVYIDDTIEIANMTDVQHGVPINVTVSGVTFGSLDYGRHFLNIYADDSHGQTSSDIVIFEKHSKPTVTIDTTIPREVIDSFSVTITYDNADGGEVTVRAFIDEQEIEA